MEEGLRLTDISKSFGNNVIFNQLSITFPKGKTTCLLGPSGCGKTTLLRMIAGLIQADSGSVHDFENLSFSFVFQEDRLLPWKTAAENIHLVLKHNMNEKHAQAVTEDHLALVKMSDYAHYYPHQLSGGMRQRISFARAFSYPSDVILLDEPFKGLDLMLKRQLMENVRSILNKDPRTVIYVTHDPEEAAFFGNTIYLLSGKPVQVLNSLEQKTQLSMETTEFEELVQRIKTQMYAKA